MPTNQTSHNDSACGDSTDNPHVVPALYLVMFPIALLLNAVAAWISLQLKSTTTFVVYLKNLVAADIIMTLIFPIKAARDLPGTPVTFYILSCYLSSIFYSTQYTCITLLCFISLDRFFKIMIPHNNFFGQNLIFSKVISGSVWVIFLGGTALPHMILNDQPVANITEICSCMKLKGPAGHEFHEKVVIYQNVFFWLVSVVIAVCYICIANRVIQSFRNSGSSNNQGKQKIKLRVFLVIVVFFVSFGPYHIVRIPYTFQQVKSPSKTDPSYFSSKFTKEVTLWLATTNTCMDPLLYVFLCREFKDKLVSMMKNVSASLRVASAGRSEATSEQSQV